MSSLGISSLNQNGAAGQSRGNGLLNAVSANSGSAAEPRSPPGKLPTADSKCYLLSDPFQGIGKPTETQNIGEAVDEPSRRQDGEIGETNVGDFESDPRFSDTKSKMNLLSDGEVVDPLEGMPEVDKWGIKGLRTLMNNYPDYHAMVVGMDPTSLGLDMGSQE